MVDAQQSEHRPHHWQVSPGCTSTDDLCARDLSHSTLRFVLAAAGQHLANPVRRGPVRQSHQIVVAGPEGMDGCPISGSRAAPAVLNDPKAGTSACDRFQQPVGEAPVEAGDGARQRHTPTLPARVAQGSMSHNARYVKLLAGPPATRLQRNTSSNSEKVQIPDAVDSREEPVQISSWRRSRSRHRRPANRERDPAMRTDRGRDVQVSRRIGPGDTAPLPNSDA